MSADQLARFATLLAEETRAEVCIALLDGRAWTAGELARAAGVTAPTMSEHLSKLVDGGVLREHRQGRHRYVQLAGPDIAGVVEHLLTLTDARPARASLRAVSANEALRRGRTCYDHVAGALGLSITDALVTLGVLDDDLAITPDGRRWLADEFGFEPEDRRRPLVRSCLDWTERRPHVADALGAHLCASLFERRWIRRNNYPRALSVTDAGRRGLRDLLSVDVSSL